MKLHVGLWGYPQSKTMQIADGGRSLPQDVLINGGAAPIDKLVDDILKYSRRQRRREISLITNNLNLIYRWDTVFSQMAWAMKNK